MPKKIETTQVNNVDKSSLTMEILSHLDEGFQVTHISGTVTDSGEETESCQLNIVFIKETEEE